MRPAILAWLADMAAECMGARKSGEGMSDL
jgi:hypothetical protein